MAILGLICRVHLMSFVVILPRYLKYFTISALLRTVINSIGDSSLEIVIALTQYGEIITVFFCENPTKHKNMHCGKKNCFFVLNILVYVFNTVIVVCFLGVTTLFVVVFTAP